MTIKTGTKVFILSFPMGGGEDWSKTGTIMRPKRGGEPPEGWLVVRFDDNGGCLCVHTERLRVQS